MLREIIPTQQKADEPRRRWFFCHGMDVLYCVDDAGLPVAFQLAYERSGRDYALRWKAELGYSHYSVDDGLPGGRSPGTPLLHAGGAFPAHEVLEGFRELAADMPPELANFVGHKLAEHPAYREPEADEADE